MGRGAKTWIAPLSFPNCIKGVKKGLRFPSSGIALFEKVVIHSQDKRR